MVVTREIFPAVLERLRGARELALDTETTGLRPYHDSRLFSVIISAKDIEGKIHSFYFNFNAQEGVSSEEVLRPGELSALGALLSEPDKTWYLHNAKFDLSILARENLEIAGTIHCTQSIERVVFNDYMPGQYDLDACASRIGFPKDDTVERYIEEHKLCDWNTEKPGQREKDLHYDRVPFSIIVPYGERDGEITYRLGRHQEEELQRIDDETQKSTSKSVPSVLNILRNERRLTKTIFKMEQVGVKINRPYCVRAASYEADRAEKARQEYKKLTGIDFKASAKDFAAVFKSEKEKWAYTEKGNPSFDSDVLKNFGHPAAKEILTYRDAKSRSDFYRSFLYFADSRDIIHPNFNPGGAATGRFSSSGPNFQNLTSEEDEEDLAQEFVVRRAIIPRPGFILYGRDYKQMEYVMTADYAAKMWGSETEMVRRIRRGEDVHQATADIVTAGGTPLARKRAKNVNFAFLYGSGYDTLAATAGCSRAEAVALKDAVKAALPEVQNLINNVSTTARTRGFIRNWAGRRSYLKDPNFAYRMTNYLIQGGCADVNKFALNRVGDFLQSKKSRMIMTIHDEMVLELHESETESVPAAVKEIMDSVYRGTYLSLTTSGYMGKTLADIEDCS